MTSVKDIPRGQRILIRGAQTGLITATGVFDPSIAQALVRAGLAKHRHGLIYVLTDDGTQVRKALVSE